MRLTDLWWQLSANGKRARVLLIALIACTTLLTGCRALLDWLTSGQVGWALRDSVRVKKVQRVRLADVTRFDWDEFYAFNPYVPTAAVCKSLSIALDNCDDVIPCESSDDGDMVLVFRNGGRIAHVEKHLRYHGDFTPLPAMPMTPDTAVFDVVADGVGASGDPWLRLRSTGLLPATGTEPARGVTP